MRTYVLIYVIDHVKVNSWSLKAQAYCLFQDLHVIEIINRVGLSCTKVIMPTWFYKRPLFVLRVLEKQVTYVSRWTPVRFDRRISVKLKRDFFP